MTQQPNPIHNENREITSNILNLIGTGNTATQLAYIISQISTCHLSVLCQLVYSISMTCWSDQSNKQTNKLI